MNVGLGTAQDLATMRCKRCKSGMFLVARAPTWIGGAMLGIECRCGWLSVLVPEHPSVPILPKLDELGPNTGFKGWPRP